MNRMDAIREIIHGNHEEIESICSINGLVDFIQTIVIWIHSSIG